MEGWPSGVARIAVHDSVRCQLPPDQRISGREIMSGKRGLAVRIIAACALTLTLASCAGQQADPQAQAQDQAAGDDARCLAQGTVPGSQDYIQCRANLENQRAQLRAVQRRAAQH
jgi:hypothetical protein